MERNSSFGDWDQSAFMNFAFAVPERFVSDGCLLSQGKFALGHEFKTGSVVWKERWKRAPGRILQECLLVNAVII